MLGLFKKKTKEVTDPKAELLAILGGAELPSFPALIMNTLELLSDPDSDNATVADSLTADPGLSVRVLQVANSAAFSVRHPVRNIQHAVSLLGRSEIESMLIAVAVREALPRRTVPGFAPSRFWLTAARRATTAKELALRIDPVNASASSTAGLLADMAIPILAHGRQQDYGSVLEQWHHGTEDLVQLERSCFDWDHATVGNWMCSEWKLPAYMADAIASHHDPDDDGGLMAVSRVGALREVNDELGRDQFVADLDARYNIPADETVTLIEDSFEKAEELARLFT